MSLRSRSKCEIKTCHEAYNHVTEKKYENTSNEKNSSKNSVKMVQFFQKLTSAIFKGIALYFIWKFVSSYILPMSKFGIRTQDNTRYINNVWSAGEKMDLYLYISSESIQTKFHQTELYLFQKDIEFGSYSKKSFLKTEKQICSSNFSQDYPLYGHIYLMRSGFHPDPKISKFNHLNCSYRRSVLTGKMKRPLKKSNLLEFSNQSFVNDHAAKDDVLYWYPEIRISIVQKTDPISENSLFSPLRKYISTTINESKYFPIVYLNEAWRISEKRLTVDSLHSIQYYPLQIIVEPISFIRFQTSVHFSESLKINQSLLGENEDIEQIKRLFSETNPYLLFVTIIVSILHTIFDFLAFKNDIQFWSSRDNLTGLSIKSIILNAGMQFIVFLYLADQNSSWLILGSSLIGTFIEIWKITKVLKLTIKFINRLPKIDIQHRDSTNSETREYDSMAMKYLGYFSIPLVISYSTYSLIYQPHKSWYSWLVNTMVGFVYTFGFLSMTPQLFINYRMKSVAHMPWKVFVYKALNTFIDDLFAFAIKMPTLHRVACFRDDVIFLVYLYQTWIYPIDKNRPNEYGQTYSKCEKNDAVNVSKSENLEIKSNGITQRKSSRLKNV